MSQQLTHWKKLCNPDYLGAYALTPGQDLIVTIKTVNREIVKGEGGKEDECTVARFREAGVKPMILNRTNCKTITKLYGTPYIEDWAGKAIQVYVTDTKVKGETTECLRIRPEVPNRTLPELTPEHQKWEGAVKSIREGTQDLAGIKKYFTLSPDNEEKLVAAVEAFDA